MTMQLVLCLFVSIGICLLMCIAQKPTQSSCRDFETCLENHLLNPIWMQMVSSRCNLESENDPTSRSISFIHLPKTGGLTVKQSLHAMGGLRIQRSKHHSHFLQVHSESPKSIFVTMLREPVSRAISYYNYVQQNDLDKNKLKNKLWMGTYNVSAVEWAGNATIQSILATDPLGYFLLGVKNIRDHVSDLNYPFIRRLPQVPFPDTIPGTLQALLEHTHDMPAEYKCTDHLKVAHILLKRFEVVGVLEKTNDFYSTLRRRANLTETAHDAAAHKHATTFRVTPAVKDRMKELLYKPLFCGHVLWKMAGLIGDADAKCAASLQPHPHRI